MNYKEDIFFSLKIGFTALAAVSVLLLGGGFLFKGFEITGALSVWRSGMCIISGLLLFLIGGMILFSGKSSNEENPKWKERFKKLSYKEVTGIIVIIFILGTIIADYIYLAVK